ncbi:hypothetical protein M2160_002731 [Streptomyces sp. SAI-117]|uniref:hypothetical protein n=1 Tax=Streptomyces sp. SAI-117 TaxID=2940546 RepID=UPI0024747FAE|nr:hypothetical protein [Streptomyces sp. SAI-117]MDH6567710.1 hypothetical protein [Streptomyces sp. SAI-117]
MTRAFDGLDRLDLDGHVRRWSEPGAVPAGADVSEWAAAAQQFAARLQDDPSGPAGLTDDQWRAVGQAWSVLLAGAERATGPQRGEWLLRDLHLRSWLLQHVGPREEVALLEPAAVLERALAAMPMSPSEAARAAPHWREQDREQIMALRMIRRLLAPVRPLDGLLADHPRWGEVQEWERVARELP